MLALEGIKVLDLTRVLSGPYCTMMMADMGADVMKIEPPGLGDDSRAFGPYVGKESAYYMSLNRNKRSMVLDFKNEKHKAVFLEMVKKADIVVENYRPGTMEKLGLGYNEVLSKINPRLIYLEISGFGATGPYKRKPAYDVVVQAMGGIMSITGPDGGDPTRVGASIGDVAAGIFGYGAAMTALYARTITGRGQAIDISMLDCQVAMLENAIARYQVTGVSPTPIGNRHPSITPFTDFEAKDGKIIVGVANQKLWKLYTDLIGRPELFEDPRFVTNLDRTNNVKELFIELAPEMKKRTVDEWIAALEEKGIPCAPINNMERICKDPQVKSRDMLVEVEHPVAGKQLVPGIPMKFSDTPGAIRKSAPLLNHDLYDILNDFLGWDKETVDQNLN